MHTKIITALLATALLLGACRKEEEKQASKTDLLTTGQWRMTAYTLSPPFDIDGDGTADANVVALFAACERDDFFVFKRDGTLEIHEGPTTCNPNDPQIDTGTWAFLNNETEITIFGDRASILELTSSRFRVSVPVSGSTGDITFTKQ